MWVIKIKISGSHEELLINTVKHEKAGGTVHGEKVLTYPKPQMCRHHPEGREQRGMETLDEGE